MIFTQLKRISNQLFLNRNGLKFLENSEVIESAKTEKVLVFLDDIDGVSSTDLVVHPHSHAFLKEKLPHFVKRNLRKLFAGLS